MVKLDGTRLWAAVEEAAGRGAGESELSDCWPDCEEAEAETEVDEAGGDRCVEDWKWHVAMRQKIELWKSINTFSDIRNFRDRIQLD